MKGRNVDFSHAAVTVLAHGWEKIVAERFKCELELRGHSIRVIEQVGFCHTNIVPIRFMILQGSPFAIDHRDSDPVYGVIIVEGDTAKKALRRWLKGIGEDAIRPDLIEGRERVEFTPEGILSDTITQLTQTFTMCLMYYFNEVRLEKEAEGVVQ